VDYSVYSALGMYLGWIRNEYIMWMVHMDCRFDARKPALLTAAVT
jgi:hypothetical protein